MSDTADIIARLSAGGIDALKPHLLPDAPLLPRVPTNPEHILFPGVDPDRELAPAAVLVGIVQRNEPTLLFTERTAHLPRHAGQISFPGGRAHEGDVSLIQTALRETEEETGITADFVTVAGFLDPHTIGSGYAILPVVGMLREGFTLRANPHEVANVFEVPLAFLLDPGNVRRESREFNGRTRSFYSFTYEDHYIWGATAAMLVNFFERLRT
jgi:8-oxo-dGTP pyrophosphatase MutT (NUDIX family)